MNEEKRVIELKEKWLEEIGRVKERIHPHEASTENSKGLFLQEMFQELEELRSKLKAETDKSAALERELVNVERSISEEKKAMLTAMTAFLSGIRDSAVSLPPETAKAS